MPETVIVNLPFFPGFYESSLSTALDRAEESQCENEAEREASREYYPETYQPEQLRLDSGDYADIRTDCMNYCAAYEDMARDYVESFDRWATENLSTAAGSFVFESMDSPREYNFATDRVYAIVSVATMEALHKGIDATKMAELIAERHTSCDGFISFYSNTLGAWEAKPFEQWDHNELGTLLCAAIASTGDSDEMRDNIEYPIYENDYEYVDRHCDWSKFAEKARERRAEKLAEWIRSDAAAARNYVDSAAEVAEIVTLALGELDSDEAAEWFALEGESHYRCPFTLDLFNRGLAGESVA